MMRTCTVKPANAYDANSTTRRRRLAHPLVPTPKTTPIIIRTLHIHSIARFWLARCALAPTIFFSRFVHMVHGMRRCAVHIARHGQHAHCAQRASGYKFCCYAQYACRKYYSQRTRCLHIYSVPRAPAGTSSAMACPAQWQARAGAAQYALICT